MERGLMTQRNAARHNNHYNMPQYYGGQQHVQWNGQHWVPYASPQMMMPSHQLYGNAHAPAPHGLLPPPPPPPPPPPAAQANNFNRNAASAQNIWNYLSPEMCKTLLMRPPPPPPPLPEKNWLVEHMRENSTGKFYSSHLVRYLRPSKRCSKHETTFEAADSTTVISKKRQTHL